MPTLADVLANPSINNVQQICGPDPRTVVITGVHSSEQVDPTPFMLGGELLLLDGLILGDTPEEVSAYVARLVAHDVRALGFGVAPHAPFRPAVPEALVAEAKRTGLTLLEIPPSTPFIAISKTVYDLIAEERFNTTRLIVDGQKQLTTAAARPNPLRGIVKKLAELTDGQVTLFDAHGRPLSPLTNDSHQVAIDRHLSLFRERELRASVREATAASSLHIQALGTERLRGTVVLTCPTSAEGLLERDLLSFAVSLLSIELERRFVVRNLERRPKAEVLARLLAGPAANRAAQLVAANGIRAKRVQIISIEDVESPEDLIDDLYAAEPDSLVRQDAETEVVMLVPAGATQSNARLAAAMNGRIAGIGASVLAHECKISLRQARHAAVTSRLEGGGLVHATQLGVARLLLELGEPEILSAFADAVLAPIEAADATQGLDLLASLRAYLEADGAHEAAATAIGVHRHTMRNHLARIEQITSRSLSSTRDRAEFWLAFEARDAAAADGVND